MKEVVTPSSQHRPSITDSVAEDSCWWFMDREKDPHRMEQLLKLIDVVLQLGDLQFEQVDVKVAECVHQLRDLFTLDPVPKGLSTPTRARSGTRTQAPAAGAIESRL